MKSDYHTEGRGQTIYDKTLKVLVKHLSDVEIVQLQITMDSDPDDGLFEVVSEYVKRFHPELFTSANETDDEVPF